VLRILLPELDVLVPDRCRKQDLHSFADELAGLVAEHLGQSHVRVSNDPVLVHHDDTVRCAFEQSAVAFTLLSQVGLGCAPTLCISQHTRECVLIDVSRVQIVVHTTGRAGLIDAIAAVGHDEHPQRCAKRRREVSEGLQALHGAAAVDQDEIRRRRLGESIARGSEGAGFLDMWRLRKLPQQTTDRHYFGGVRSSVNEQDPRDHVHVPSWPPWPVPTAEGRCVTSIEIGAVGLRRLVDAGFGVLSAPLHRPSSRCLHLNSRETISTDETLGATANRTPGCTPAPSQALVCDLHEGG